MLVTDNKSLIIMGSIFVTCSLMSIFHIYIGVVVICIAAIALRIMSATHVIKPLNRFYIRVILFIGILVLTVSAAVTPNLADTFISLLMMGCSLKFLEYANKRDLYVQCCALLFLTIIPLIFHYQFYIMIYIIVMCIMIIWAFVSITHVLSVKEDLRLLLKIIFPAVPVTIVMFLVLPRTGAFWVIPNMDKTQTGISSSLNIDGLGDMSKSDKLVARVVFHGNIPNSRYFRALVYEKYSAEGWTEGDDDRKKRQTLDLYKYLPTSKAQPQPVAATTDYDIILENTGTPYIPTLRYSYTNMKRVFYLSTDVYTTSSSSSGRQYYHFTYLPDKSPQTERIGTRQADNTLYYSEYNNESTQAFVKQITADAENDQQKVQAILTFFSSGNFRYTLTPGRYGRANFLDDFLFNRKQGYCVHYATAMALMLRMAGIPSRVVGGYMGGEVNADENYVTLREYDAHAWVEAYVNHKWIEFDPTALIANWNYTSEGESVIGASNGIRAEGGLLNSLGRIREFVDMQWTMFILNFDSERQQSLFKGSIAAVLGLVLIAFAAYVAIIMLTSGDKKRIRMAPELIIMRKAVKAILKNEPQAVEIWHTYGHLSSILTEKNSPYAAVFTDMYALYLNIHYKPADRETAVMMSELKRKFSILKKI